MQINKIKATNVELTEAIQTYVEEKFLSLAPLVANWEPVADMDIEIGKVTEHHNKGMIFLCEVNLEIPGELVRVEVKEEDLYAAIDKAKDDLRLRLVDIKEKMIERNRQTPEEKV